MVKKGKIIVSEKENIKYGKSINILINKKLGRKLIYFDIDV